MSSSLPRPAPLDYRSDPPFDLPELVMPNQFYGVTSRPAPLAGMILPPQETPWARLHQIGFRHVVCLCSDRPRYDPTPLTWLVKMELCDLVERPLPEDPATEERVIRLIARAIASHLENGEGVIVHCAGGRGRTGTVLGCVLRQLGHPAEEVVAFLDGLHQRRGKKGWPEAAWQREVVERPENLDRQDG